MMQMNTHCQKNGKLFLILTILFFLALENWGQAALQGAKAAESRIAEVLCHVLVCFMGETYQLVC